MSHAFIPSREEIGDPWAKLEAYRKRKLATVRSVPAVIPVINKAKQKPAPEPIAEQIKPVRDIIKFEKSSDFHWPPCTEPERMTAAKIIREVALEYGLLPSDIKSHLRNAYVVEARFKCLWRMKTETLMSLPMMGRALGNRDHTSCLAGLRRYQQRMREGSHERQLRMYGPVSGATVTVVKGLG